MTELEVLEEILSNVVVIKFALCVLLGVVIGVVIFKQT